MQTNVNEIEQSVLGCVLIGNKDTQTDILDIINEDDFIISKNKPIIHAMKELRKKNIFIDLISLSNELSIENDNNDMEYITTLINFVPSASNYQYYIASLKELSKKRILKQCAVSIMDNIDNGETADGTLKVIEKSLNDIDTKDNILNKDQDITITAENEFNKIRNAINGIYENVGIKTGFEVFDDVLYGLHNSDLLIVGARAGVGKTAFALNIINNISIESNRKTLFFSLEMPKDQIMHRLYSINAQINGTDLNKGKLKNNEFEKIKATKEKILKSNIIINDDSSITPIQMFKYAKHIKRNGGLDLIIVDYLQFVKPNNQTNNKFLDIGDIAKELKRMARELNVPVIALAQLNRALDKEDRLPVLADLRESGDIENNADVVVLMHSKANDMNDPRDTSLIIAKNRNGARKIIRTKYYGSMFTFKEVAPKENKDMPKPKEVEIKEGDMPF